MPNKINLYDKAGIPQFEDKSEEKKDEPIMKIGYGRYGYDKAGMTQFNDELKEDKERKTANLTLAIFRTGLAIKEAESVKSEHLYHVLETKLVIIDVKTLRLLHEFSIQQLNKS